jgi:hypothetical protein
MEVLGVPRFSYYQFNAHLQSPDIHVIFWAFLSFSSNITNNSCSPEPMIIKQQFFNWALIEPKYLAGSDVNDTVQDTSCRW